MSNEPNPYAAPKAEFEDKSPPRWRIVPTTVLAVLGVGSFAIGLRVATIVANLRWIGDPKWRPMFVVCVVWLVIGLLWIKASRFIWKQSYGKGLITAIVGILIPIVLLSF